MEIVEDSLDAILFELYKILLRDGHQNIGSRGENIEKIGVSLCLEKPRARLSRSENRGKPFSALGELLWYLSNRDDLSFIEKYVPAYKDDATGGVIHGAYGPRLFNMRCQINQVDNVYKLLSKKPGSRRAVIQLFNAEDIEGQFLEIPCTTTMQFHIREDQLHMGVTMRSNDAFWGLPHDIFCFTMIQEMMATRLNVQLGCYYHYVGSMHIYNKFKNKAQEYIDEGFQKTVEMPQMPMGNSFGVISPLMVFENEARCGNFLNPDQHFISDYWADIGRLIQVFWANGSDIFLDQIKAGFKNKMYIPYLEGRRGMKSPN